MKKNYGIPYQGSKAKIVNKLIEFIPPAENFYDLFGGGFSVSHYVIEECQDKFKRVYYNEIDKNSVPLIKKAISGYYNYKNFFPKFIDRELFFKEKDNDWYIKYIWSFGNDGKTYLFGKSIEYDKKSLHDAITFNIFNERAICLTGISTFPPDMNDRKLRRLYLRKLLSKINHKNAQQLEQLERLQQLERLEQLERLHFSTQSYEEVDIKENSVIYCDIPYKGTKGYGQFFDYNKFFNWAHNSRHPIFISEYNIEDTRFSLVAEIEHRGIMSAKKNNKVIEKLYCNSAGITLLAKQKGVT